MRAEVCTCRHIPHGHIWSEHYASKRPASNAKRSDASVNLEKRVYFVLSQTRADADRRYVYRVAGTVGTAEVKVEDG
jgi:hypothetical protein